MLVASMTPVAGQNWEEYVPRPVAGSSWEPVVPIKNMVVVGYDNSSNLDDLAYIAAVPTAVFHSEKDQALYSSPLIFWEPPRGSSGPSLPLESSMGVDYFVEDWMNYSGGSFDNVQFVNMQRSDADSLAEKWNAGVHKVYEPNNPYKTARDLALYNWRYSDEVVVAVIDPSPDQIDIEYSGEAGGVIPGIPIKNVLIQGEKEPSPVNPNMHPFNIPPDYKYVTSDMQWYGPSGQDVINSITQRGRDPDLQLYDMQLGEVAASEEWNVLSGPGEYIGSYVYHQGQWASAVTYMPTEDVWALDSPQGKDPSKLPARPDTNPTKPGSKVTYEITNTMYPGADVVFTDEKGMPMSTPFMCRDAEFVLKWSASVDLGLIIRGPSGAVIAEDLEPGGGGQKIITIKDLGEGIYTGTAIKLDGGTQDSVTFNITYKYHQYNEKSEGESWSSAAQGAVLASLHNSPLLYANKKGLPKATMEALNTLGVKKVYLIDIGNRGKDRVFQGIKDVRSWFQDKIKIEKFTRPYDIYEEIHTFTESDFIVFTSMSQWTYWYVGEGPKGEEEGGYYIGPATYAAAHHGCPVFIVETHPKLSTSAAWHNTYWIDAYLSRYPPSVGSMVLTGKEVYSFLDEFGFDAGGMESMMTVAGQFDIGTSWDRVFVGAAIPGRIMGSPIDASYWISRCSLYQAIIFSNPATSTGGTIMKTGSSSKFYNGVLQISPEYEVNAVYPVVNTWVSYQHKFNERGSIYWGADYITADGITPYRTGSGVEIDVDGVWPDLTTSEIVPHYAKHAGYTPVFSSNFEDTMINLNKGSLLWLEVMHGGHRGAGVVGFWNKDQIESNPWRGYESGGSTFEPDTVIMGKNIGFDLIRNPTRSDRLHDGVVIAIVDQAAQTVSYDGYDFDNSFENLHSMGFNGGSCLIANTYMHLAMVRHGMSFQVIDPWLTSWYASFAMETWLRDLVFGKTVGEAYQGGIQHVGIQYLVEQWWWDIYENVIFYGDPDMMVFTPVNAWEEPEPLWDGETIGGHAPFGAPDHPHKIKDTFLQDLAITIAAVAGIAVLLALAIMKIKKRRALRRRRRRRRKGKKGRARKKKK
jgi:hypothetical protein